MARGAHLPRCMTLGLDHASAVLPSGKVFVAGGEFGTGDSTAEIYDPIKNTWQYTTEHRTTVRLATLQPSSSPTATFCCLREFRSLNPYFQTTVLLDSTLQIRETRTAPLSGPGGRIQSEGQLGKLGFDARRAASWPPTMTTWRRPEHTGRSNIYQRQISGLMTPRSPSTFGSRTLTATTILARACF